MQTFKNDVIFYDVPDVLIKYVIVDKFWSSSEDVRF